MPYPIEHPSLRKHAPAGATIRAGVAVLLALTGAMSVACRGNDDAAAPPPAATPATTAAPVQAAMPQAPVVVAQAAPATDAASPPSKPSGSRAEVEARLDRMLKAAESCSGPDECRTVPVGGKACGGPTGYRAYSAKGADPEAVEALAREEHELAMADARASGRVSNCMIQADPGARCVQNKCVTGGPNAPRGAVTR